MRKILSALFLAAHLWAAAQTPEVPHKMRFADMTLTIRDDARREIQKDVNALTQSPRHFNIKAERARTYFPIIEKIFAEEEVPDDFKYLVLQESALIPDAVSVSKAVGFWQFKDFTAVEMGLRVDKQIDERMNIAASTRAAARYIKKNNFYFNNWIYALQAYQMGAGGVMQSVKNSRSGEKHLEITSKTYWYIKKYLAHKVAFENAVNEPGQLKVLSYENRTKKTLAELAREISVDEEELKAYNKWARNGNIPDDKLYIVAIPIAGSKNISLPASQPADALAVKPKSTKTVTTSAKVKEEKEKINGLYVLRAKPGDNATSLAARGGIEVSFFLKCNEMDAGDPIQPGMYYFLQKKRNRAEEAYHKVEAGENLWEVSQQYGVRTRKLRRFNRIHSDSEIKAGAMLWLASMKPKNSTAEIEPTEIAQVDKDQTFNWEPVAVARTERPAEQTSQEIPGSPDVQVQSTGPAEIVQTDEPADSVSVSDPVQQTIDTLKSEGKIVAAVGSDYTAPDTTKRIPITIRPRQHTVLAGETLYAIAKQYDLEVMDLVAWNELKLQEAIKPGQIIRLFDSQAAAEKDQPTDKKQEILHEVKASDTLYSVARRYGVTIKELMDWNGKKDFNVSVGEKLKVIPR